MPETDLLAEPLLDAREAAKLLHVPRSTLYELVRSRGLPHVSMVVERCRPMVAEKCRSASPSGRVAVAPL